MRGDSWGTHSRSDGGAASVIGAPAALTAHSIVVGTCTVRTCAGRTCAVRRLPEMSRPELPSGACPLVSQRPARVWGRTTLAGQFSWRQIREGSRSDKPQCAPAISEHVAGLL